MRQHQTNWKESETEPKRPNRTEPNRLVFEKSGTETNRSEPVPS